MKKVFAYILLCSAITTFAQQVEKTGLTFLKNGFGARNIAMGDLGVVISDEATGHFYNPAILQKGNYNASFTHSNLMQDVTSEMIGASFTFLDMPFAIGINTTSIADIEVRTKPGEADSKFNANYFFGSFSTAYDINEKISVGITGKYLYENLFSDDATGWGLDAGIFYKNVFNNFNFGASLQNLGSMSKLRQEATKLPSSLNAAVSYDYSFDSASLDVTVAAGFKRYLDAESNHFQMGGEVEYNNIIALRAGYVSGLEAKDLSYGMGIKWESFSFDYAFVPVDFGLGNSSYITLIYAF